MLTQLTPPQRHTWQWQGFPIHYQQAGEQGDAIVLVHGFGASSDHWRKNIPVLAEHHRVYALDLIGFGRSAKPAPGELKPGEQVPYLFETWGQQIADFIQDVVKEPVFLVGNSIGCVAALQAAVNVPSQVQGLVLLDCALRQIHDRKLSTQPPMRRLGRPLLKKVLKNRALVHSLFRQVAKPGVVRKILLQAYGQKEAVTDELVDILMEPARDPGAADVFWAFINNFSGPLAEDLLPNVTCPVVILWGEADPWEPIALGRALGEFATVEEFIPLPGVGHCPQDEAPDQINTFLQDWISRHRAIAPALP